MWKMCAFINFRSDFENNKVVLCDKSIEISPTESDVCEQKLWGTSDICRIGRRGILLVFTSDSLVGCYHT